MRQHTVVGSDLCARLPSMRAVAPIVRSHHEQWNGGGYPDGLKGEEIPLLARIFQVLDIYDALSSKRPYKEAFPRKKCFQMMEELRGKQFDPRVLDAFFRCRRSITNVQIQWADLD